MSHFVTAVFVPTSIASNPKILESHLNDVLETYNEGREVDEYDRDCHCIGHVARKEARERADAEHGTIASLRESFALLVLSDGRKVADMQKRNHELSWSRTELSMEESKECKALSAETSRLWQDYIAERVNAEEKYFNEHPMKESPDQTCGFDDNGKRYDDESGCAGTGTYRSSYNPQSKWDWWVIGGRWTGWLAPPEAQPEKNPDNWEKCWLCAGTGLRNDALGVQTRLENPEYTCNGCNGKGTNLKWPTELADDGYNVVAPRYIESLGIIDPDEGLPTPFAFVTTDGEWHERGQMGWFGISHNESDTNLWQEEWRKALSDHSDGFDGYRVVVVDMHI